LSSRQGPLCLSWLPSLTPIRGHQHIPAQDLCNGCPCCLECCCTQDTPRAPSYTQSSLSPNATFPRRLPTTLLKL
jgi:hypothetical protein